MGWMTVASWLASWLLLHNVPCSEVHRLAVGATQHHMQWVLAALSLRVKQSRWKLITHIHIVLRLRMSGAVPLLPHMLL